MSRRKVARRLAAAAALVADAGVQVTFEDDWRTRGRRGIAPRVHVEHTTEDARPISDARMRQILRDGHGSLSGNPICNAAILRQGPRLHLVAAGVAWHAGRGSWAGWSGNSRALGTEWQRAQGQALTGDMLEIGALWSAALLEVFAWPPAVVCEHHEWTERKSDRRLADGRSADGEGWRARLATTDLHPVEDDMLIDIDDGTTTIYQVLGGTLHVVPTPAHAEVIAGPDWRDKVTTIPADTAAAFRIIHPDDLYAASRLRQGLAENKGASALGLGVEGPRVIRWARGQGAQLDQYRQG